MVYYALEDLWLAYQLEKLEIENPERKTLIDLMMSQEQKLKSYLDENQLKELEKYNYYMDELSDNSEKNAFMKGVRLGTQYIIETMLFDGK